MWPVATLVTVAFVQRRSKRHYLVVATTKRHIMWKMLTQRCLCSSWIFWISRELITHYHFLNTAILLWTFLAVQVYSAPLPVLFSCCLSVALWSTLTANRYYPGIEEYGEEIGSWCPPCFLWLSFSNNKQITNNKLKILKVRRTGDFLFLLSVRII